jgi:hypothetical protein
MEFGGHLNAARDIMFRGSDRSTTGEAWFYRMPGEENEPQPECEASIPPLQFSSEPCLAPFLFPTSLKVNDV